MCRFNCSDINLNLLCFKCSDEWFIPADDDDDKNIPADEEDDNNISADDDDENIPADEEDEYVDDDDEDDDEKKQMTIRGSFNPLFVNYRL